MINCKRAELAKIREISLTVLLISNFSSSFLGHLKIISSVFRHRASKLREGKEEGHENYSIFQSQSNGDSSRIKLLFKLEQGSTVFSCHPSVAHR